MYAWNLTAKTILHTEKWKELFWKQDTQAITIGLNLNE